MLDDAGYDTRRVGSWIRSRLQPLCHAKACCQRSFDGRQTGRLLVPPRKSDSDSTRDIFLTEPVKFLDISLFSRQEVNLAHIFLCVSAVEVW